MAVHRLDASAPLLTWSRAHPPRVSIRSGDEVIFETLDSSGGVITPATRSADLETLHMDPNPLSGPVFIEGAEPGDALDVEVVSLAHRGYGWTAIFPGFGLLADEFSDPYLHHCTLTDTQCLFRDDVRLPLRPFCGEMGVAPAEGGDLSTIPPGNHGGNLDIPRLMTGSVVTFPVAVPGALFCCGDCHASQGDGEVNGTGIEAGMDVRLRFTLKKGQAPSGIAFRTPARPDIGECIAEVVIGDDLRACARDAVRRMIDRLTAEYGLRPEEAYCLCGAVADVTIHQLVNGPATVSCMVPVSIFVTAR